MYKRQCELRPKAFFVAWSGVLTLAWEGFPPAIASLKRRIASAFPALPPEKPGSRWAKTTLGCLREGARLTPSELDALVELCRCDDAFAKALKTIIRERGSPRHVPAIVCRVPDVPRTNNGKKVEMACMNLLRGRPVANRGSICLLYTSPSPRD